MSPHVKEKLVTRHALVQKWVISEMSKWCES